MCVCVRTNLQAGPKVGGHAQAVQHQLVVGAPPADALQQACCRIRRRIELHRCKAIGSCRIACGRNRVCQAFNPSANGLFRAECVQNCRTTLKAKQFVPAGGLMMLVVSKVAGHTGSLCSSHGAWLRERQCLDGRKRRAVRPGDPVCLGGLWPAAAHPRDAGNGAGKQRTLCRFLHLHKDNAMSMMTCTHVAEATSSPGSDSSVMRYGSQASFCASSLESTYGPTARRQNPSPHEQRLPPREQRPQRRRCAVGTPAAVARTA